MMKRQKDHITKIKKKNRDVGVFSHSCNILIANDIFCWLGLSVKVTYVQPESLNLKLCAIETTLLTLSYSPPVS